MDVSREQKAGHSANSSFTPLSDIDRPLVIAHRGASAEAPENTLAAFRLALEQGCDAIELDIHLSKDCRIIVCHDATIDRTTNGTGAIVGMTAEELMQYDAGSWFDGRFAGERLPLLDEVLDLVPAAVELNIEIKCTDHPDVIEAVLALLESRKRLGSVFFSCFSHDCMIRLKRAAPTARIGLLYEEDADNALTLFRRERIEGYSLHPRDIVANESHIQAAREQGLRVFPWTIDDRERMQRFIDAGVSGIITNRPHTLRQIVG